MQILEPVTESGNLAETPPPPPPPPHKKKRVHLI